MFFLANSYWPTTSATATATVQSPLTFSSTFRPITSSPSSVSSLRLDNEGLSSDEEIAEADGSDVEVLAVLKPRHLRTPPLVELDDEKTEDNEVSIAVSSGKLRD